ncbi:DNA replication complex subunit Gins51 [Halorientalis salina]|uniref:DNA replication complex subunit Gins51 n=1 Tax=Halorientalis salina TaxID=2932266 RepID=UPI0010AC0A00|nr:hypothetical protein [Halorientalis salina]
MNLDELQSIRDRERQSDSLQQLRETFYADAGEFVQNLREERETAAARADDPFDSPEVNRLSDDIKTAEQTVEAIYERRVGKLVKMASFAAADMPTEDEGLTAEERELFEQLVASIEANRDQVFGVLDGDDAESGTDSGQTDASPAQESPEPTAPDPTDGVDAADLMGGTDSASTAETQSDDPQSDTDGKQPSSTDGSRSRAEMDPTDTDRPAPEAGVGSDGDSSESTRNGTQAVPPDGPDGQASEPDVVSVGDGPDATQSAGGTDEPQGGRTGTTPEAEPRSDGGGDRRVDRTTVRITRDVGEILGVDDREYDLSSEDVVTLPATNADPLVERDAAERLD